jgi:hypothetical protein
VSYQPPDFLGKIGTKGGKGDGVVSYNMGQALGVGGRQSVGLNSVNGVAFYVPAQRSEFLNGCIGAVFVDESADSLD